MASFNGAASVIEAELEAPTADSVERLDRFNGAASVIEAELFESCSWCHGCFGFNGAASVIEAEPPGGQGDGMTVLFRGKCTRG